MHRLDLTLLTPAGNLALDEALLEAAEAGETGDVLRFWEPHESFVVLGRSSRLADEVDLAACQAANVPVLRRASGGAAVVAGPGCLMYSVIQSYAGREHLRMLDELHRQVLGAVCGAVSRLVPEVAHQGTCDLVVGDRKFSGNAVRCKRDHFLYHGTLLYNFDLTTISRFLKPPPRQPDYRQNRSHADFVTNLPVDPVLLRTALANALAAHDDLRAWPEKRASELTTYRYSQAAWTQSR